nr:PilZ domain-containing protein [uncultured Desulfobacter sp.]
MMTLLNFKISDELKSELQKTREKAGLQQEDFISAMLARFKESQSEIDTESPIYKELAKVKQFFAQSERLVANFMELAANEKIQAEKKAKEIIDAAQKKIAGLEEKIQGLKGLNQSHETKISEQGKIISGLQKKAETLKTLEKDWSEKENELNTRIAELDAKETVITDRINEIFKLEQQLALANQQSESDQDLIKDLKSRVDNLQSEIANLEEKSAKAQATLASEKSVLTKRIDENQATNAEEYERLTDTAFSLEEDFIDLESRKFKRKKVTFEIDVLVEGRLIKTNTKDISASGILVQTKKNIEKYKKAKMVFSIPGIEKPFKLEGRVVRSTGSNIAIEFDEKSPEFQFSLNNKIWQLVHN